MRYRFELIDGWPMIHNVETNVWVGAVLRPEYVIDAVTHSPIYIAGEVVNTKFEKIAILLNERDVSGEYLPLSRALHRAAIYEQASDYSDFRSIKDTPSPTRIEENLGTLMADAACSLACALSEHRSSGLLAHTKERLADQIARLFEIAWVSRFGSYDAERNVWEAYFRNAPPSDPRMHFSEAALRWGGFYLHQRCPRASEAILKEILSWVVELVQELIYKMMEPDPSSLH